MRLKREPAYSRKEKFGQTSRYHASALVFPRAVRFYRVLLAENTVGAVFVKCAKAGDIRDTKLPSIIFCHATYS